MTASVIGAPVCWTRFVGAVVCSALVRSVERAHKEIAMRDDMIRTAHRVGASLRQIAEASGLGRKTVTAIVEADPLRP